MKKTALSALVFVTLIFVQILSSRAAAADFNGESIVTFDFDKPYTTIFELKKSYYNRSLAENVHKSATENWEEYYDNIRTAYLKQWNRIDNFELSFENLDENVLPLVRSLRITGDWWPSGYDGVYRMRITGGQDGFQENVTIKLPENFVSWSIPAPTIRTTQDNRETLFFQFDNQTPTKVYFTEDESKLLYSYIFNKMNIGHEILLAFAFFTIFGLGVAQTILKIMQKKAKSSNKKFPSEYSLYLLRISAAINSLFLVAAALVELSAWGTFLLIPAILLGIFSIKPQMICSLFSKIGASLEPHRSEHLGAILLYINAFWISSLLLAVLYTDTEIQRLIAFNTDISISSLLLSMASFVFLAFVGVGFKISHKRGKIYETLKTTFTAARVRLGLVRPKSFWTETSLGLFVAGTMAALVWAISHWVSPSAVAEEMMKQVTVVSAAVLSISAGIGEEILFRGALQPRFGIALTALLFGILHSTYGSVTHVGLAVLMGALLGLVYRRQRNILSPIVGHSAYNLLIFALFWAR